MGKHPTAEHVNEVMDKNVAKKQPIATLSDVQKLFPAADTLRYIKNDTLAADPTKILGMVYYEKIDSHELIPFVTSIDAIVDETTVLTSPQMMSELIIESTMSASGGFLSFLSLSLNKNEVYELRVINNTTGRINNKGNQWDQAVKNWMQNSYSQDLINDPNVGAISIVVGVVQKFMTSKKYKKFETDVKGGGWGVNVAGSLYMSSSEFQLDIVYGIDLISIPKVINTQEFAEKIALGSQISKGADLDNVNDLFVKMAKERASIFP